MQTIKASLEERRQVALVINETDLPKLRETVCGRLAESYDPDLDRICQALRGAHA